MHPGVNRVHAVAWRRWRRKLFSRDTWRAMAELRARSCATQRYDCVLDLQGSAEERAVGPPGAAARSIGYDGAQRARGRRPPGCTRRKAAVSWDRARRRALPACWRRRTSGLSRCRAGAPAFGIAPGQSGWKLRGGRSAALIPCASRPEKIMAEAALDRCGQAASKPMGLSPVVIWGTEEEQVRAERIAAGCEGEVPPFLSVHDMAALLSQTKRARRAGHRLHRTWPPRSATADVSASTATTSPGSAGIVGPAGRPVSAKGPGAVR